MNAAGERWLAFARQDLAMAEIALKEGIYLPSEHLSLLREEISQLDIYYIVTRYPDALPGVLTEGLPGAEDAENAIAAARACWREICAS